MNDDLRMELADCGSPEKLLTVIFEHHAGWTPPVPLRDFASAVGITEIREHDTEAFEGALVTDAAKTNGVILCRPGLEPRQRFTIAHELGHFLMPSHRGASCTARNLKERGTKDPAQRAEAEANRFAAGLLMPKLWIERDEAKQELDLDRVRAIAKRYSVSVEAAANRYVELSDVPCAVVFWKDCRVRYGRANSRFPLLDAKTGAALPKVTLDQARAPGGVTEWIERDGGQWLSGTRTERVPSLLQQSLVQQNGHGLTLLQLSVEDESDEEEETNWSPPSFSRR